MVKKPNVPKENLVISKEEMDAKRKAAKSLRLRQAEVLR